jgi:hypothetical protein
MKLKTTLGKLSEAPSIEDFYVIRNRVDGCENEA